ncbi:RNase H domain-containing protein [Trichonephila clavipes]|nr:RNase H domain-containing protein [Trichonephila clavipes]
MDELIRERDAARHKLEKNNSDERRNLIDISRKVEDEIAAFKPPPSAKIIFDLLEPCTKKEPKVTIKRKGMDTIIGLMRPHLVTAYIDGSLTQSAIEVDLVSFLSNLCLYLTRTNIANSDGIIVLSDCRSVLEATKKGKMGLTQEINSLLYSICALGKSFTL